MNFDFATVAGLLFGTALVSFAILAGSGFGIFLDLHAFLIVVGGTFANTMIKFPISGVFVSMPVGLKAAFTNDKLQASDLIDLAINLARKAKKTGLQSLEGSKVPNQFFKKGIQLCADGKDAEFIRKVLTEEMTQEIRREEIGSNVFLSIGEAAPAFGLFGTLVGLVQMLSNMSDPTKIGNAMAIAMLATLYGVLLANLFALPISDKLASKVISQHNQRSLILECVIQLQKLQNPTEMRDILEPYLPNNQRDRTEESEVSVPAKRDAKASAPAHKRA